MVGPEYEDSSAGYIRPEWTGKKLPDPIPPLPKEELPKFTKSSAEAAEKTYERLKDKTEKHDDFGSSDDTIDDVVN